MVAGQHGESVVTSHDSTPAFGVLQVLQTCVGT